MNFWQFLDKLITNVMEFILCIIALYLGLWWVTVPLTLVIFMFLSN